MAQEPDEQRGSSPDDEGIPDVDEDFRDKRDFAEHDEGVPIPGDRPRASHDRVTVREQREGETLNERVAREQPEPSPESTIGRLEEPTEDGRDTTKELAATETDDHSAPSPEERAMHIVEDDETA